MQYRSITDYAVKALVQLAGSPKREYIPLHEISLSAGTSNSTMLKVVRALRSAKWIISVAGKEGGYRFVGNADKITLYSVQKAMGDTMTLSKGVNKKQDTVLKEIYDGFCEHTREYFSRITIKDLITIKEADNASEFIQGLKGPETKDSDTLLMEEEIESLRKQIAGIKQEYSITREKIKRVMGRMVEIDSTMR